jgi:hypothetical protein
MSRLRGSTSRFTVRRFPARGFRRGLSIVFMDRNDPSAAHYPAVNLLER